MHKHRTQAGPQGRRMIERDQAVLSPSYRREYGLVVDQALGSEVWDIDGRRYIDFMAGVAVMNVGHRHPYVLNKVKEQLDRFWHICLSDFYYPEAIELAEKLQKIAPMPDTRVYFANSGTEAVEAALKLAMYHTGRSKFLGFLGSFHGRTLGSLSFTASKAVQRRGYQGGLSVYHVPYPNPYRPILNGSNVDDVGQSVIDFLEDQIFRSLVSPDDIAGIVLEPIQGEGGYIVPAPGFMLKLRKLCDRYGILLIADEIQTGAGRTGYWWAVEHDDIQPDILCFAKGVGSGFPIGGIIARSELMSWEPGAHGSTFGGNPIAATAAQATLHVIDQEKLLERATVSGSYLMDILAEIQSRHACIGDVRGRGLMIGVEIVADKTQKEPAPALRESIVEKAFLNGLLIIPCGPSSIRLTPALNISKDLLDEGIQLLEVALTEAEKDHR